MASYVPTIPGLLQTSTAWPATEAAHDGAFRRGAIAAIPILIIVAAVIAYAIVGR